VGHEHTLDTVSFILWDLDFLNKKCFDVYLGMFFLFCLNFDELFPAEPCFCSAADLYFVLNK